MRFLYCKLNGGHCNPMPNSLIDQLLRVASSSSGNQAASVASAIIPAHEALRALTAQIESLRGLYQAQPTQTAENTVALLQNTRSKTTEVTSTAANLARSASSGLGSGLTLLPLISGIARLFGFGAKNEALSPLQSFALPSAIDLDGGISQTGSSPISGISYGPNGLPRSVSAAPRSANTSINVSVQTIDARSFLDHSDDIARAVREAMLNSHPLNDVISEV